MSEAGKQALWGGRFEGASDPLFRRFNDSLPFDYRLAMEDIAGSIAWAKAIHRAGVLSPEELAQLLAALAELAVDIEKNPAAPLGSGEEDVHSWVESRLIKRVGTLGKKLHTGRSRNDQVATDLRLWTRSQIDARAGELVDLQRSLVDLARRHASCVIPGYTHLQRAQPVLLGHWCLAYVEMFDRDRARLADARRRVNVCPLGSGALAGTAYAVDRDQIARDLGFDAATANSLDAVSDRDFVVETLGALSLAAVHLSRMAEDMILYCTQEFGFLELSDAVSSGSSLMPQKKNPDSLELIRGKCGRIVGSHAAMTVTLKGLPLAYNKDMQEDKEPLFDAMESASLSLRMAAVVVANTSVREQRTLAAAKGGYSNATDLADYLVAKGVAFRESHEIVGRAVRFALAADKPLEDLTLDELRQFCPLIGEDVFAALAVESCLRKREVAGGTGPAAVSKAVESAARRLGMA
ncbi:MAG: Argininosuccinate lyase [Phycisphaerales bacterium]|nr:Argininosuccinate lyase [Phycisphaerales bacterium]